MANNATELTHTDRLLNDFAVRSFRDTGDLDYIAARLAFRAKLFPQFMWSGLQAIEKYYKCILLMNRIPAKNLGHDLGRALRLINTHAPFKVTLSGVSDQFVEYLNQYGRFRYLEIPWHASGIDLLRLDKAVWEIRRYAQVIDYRLSLLNGSQVDMLKVELARIAKSEKESPHKFQIPHGMLEKIIIDRAHPAREPLLWKNLFFGTRARPRVPIRQFSHSVNSPLSLHPEILDEVVKHIFLPKDVERAYRNERDGNA